MSHTWWRIEPVSLWSVARFRRRRGNSVDVRPGTGALAIRGRTLPSSTLLLSFLFTPGPFAAMMRKSLAGPGS